MFDLDTCRCAQQDARCLHYSPYLTVNQTTSGIPTSIGAGLDIDHKEPLETLHRRHQIRRSKAAVGRQQLKFYLWVQVLLTA